MIIDSSAILAILFAEPEADRLIHAISNDTTRMTSCVSALEISIVVETRKGATGGREFDLFMHKTQVEIAGMNADQVEIAKKAYRNFGRGRHQAKLNLGDCCAYALSRYSGEPLLFKGKDFTLTDVALVKY